MHLNRKARFGLIGSLFVLGIAALSWGLERLFATHATSWAAASTTVITLALVAVTARYVALTSRLVKGQLDSVRVARQEAVVARVLEYMAERPGVIGELRDHFPPSSANDLEGIQPQIDAVHSFAYGIMALAAQMPTELKNEGVAAGVALSHATIAAINIKTLLDNPTRWTQPSAEAEYEANFRSRVPGQPDFPEAVSGHLLDEAMATCNTYFESASAFLLRPLA